MRSTAPMKGNPWPHAMVISVDPDPQQILELLWVREAWGLRPADVDVPMLVGAPERVGEPTDRDAWETAWPQVWEDVVQHTGVLVEPSRFEDELRRAAVGSQERAELLRRAFGPSWRDRFGDDAFGEEFRTWSHRRFEEQKAQRPRSVAESPERMALDALVPAWEAGLAKVVTIPCRGDYTRVIGGSVLLVTEDTRRDADRYAAALEAFDRR